MKQDTNSPDPAAVARALAMAVHLPTERAERVHVQVVDRRGFLLGSGMLQGMEQATFLKDVLQSVGSFQMGRATLAHERGCDVLIVEATDAAPAALATQLVRAESALAWPAGPNGSFNPLRTVVPT